MIELLKPLVGGHYIVGNSFSSRDPYTRIHKRVCIWLNCTIYLIKKGEKIGTKNGGQ